AGPSPETTRPQAGDGDGAAAMPPGPRPSGTAAGTGGRTPHRHAGHRGRTLDAAPRTPWKHSGRPAMFAPPTPSMPRALPAEQRIGRASCRERVYNPVEPGQLKKTNMNTA